MQYLSCSVAFFMTILAIWLIEPLALRIGLVDSPGGRKLHQGEIPLIGGVAMFFGFVFALLTLPISLASFRSFIAACGLIVVVGVLDDFHELSAKARFVTQVIAAILMTVWGQNILSSFGNLFFLGNFDLGILSIPLTIIAVVGIINAINMMDGMDGLAGSIGLCQLILLFVLAYVADSYMSVLVLLCLITALLGFLVFNIQLPNRKHAHIFMGDAGSMFLGVALSWFLISLAQGIHPAARPVTMLWIMIVPLFDTTRLLISRTLNKRSPFSPSRDHIHHLLLARNFSPTIIILLLSFITLASGFFAILCGHFNVSDSVMFLIYILLFVGFYLWTQKHVTEGNLYVESN